MPDDAASKVDAVLFHQMYKRGGTIYERLRFIQDQLGPVLGGTVHSADVGDGWFLARLDPSQTLLFPKAHALAGAQRYTWTDQAPGLKYGTLRDEAKA
jgi:hypothetical protein